MSFQGDVGGIGLAELLQSLTRGRREGVLRLTTPGGLVSTLGLCDGMVFFLPEEAEDPQIWKDRARQAWIHDPDFRIDAVRMSEIARAHRIERVYEILDSEVVHFRFDPGALPRRPTDGLSSVEGEGQANQARMPEVHCEGIAIEFLLLEFARMTDEFEGLGGVWWFTDYAIPRAMDLGSSEAPLPRVLQECDGTSTLSEISDRLGWPIRQTRLAFADYFQKGQARLVQVREYLVLTQRELAAGHVSRAAARLVGWVQTSPPGPTEEGNAKLLAEEFKADRMSAILNLMPAREARVLLRRLDFGLLAPDTSVKHWRELQRLKRHDPIIELHRLACEYRWEEDEETPSLRELLDMARQLRDQKQPWRAAAFLRMAASRNPAAPGVRIDIGLGFLSAELIEEAAAWIIDGCQTLIASGHAEKAISPLRALVEANPDIREARRMLGRLRHLTVRRQLIRKHSLVALAIVGALSLGAWVQIRSERETDQRLAEIAQQISDPSRALEMIERYFPEDDSQRVENLRTAIDGRRQALEGEVRNDWYEKYREAQLACTLGDPLEGLQRALDLPVPPRLTTVNEPWPLVSDLYNGLAARLEKELGNLGEVELDHPEQVRGEKDLGERGDRLLSAMAELDKRRDLGDLEQRLEAIAGEINRRLVDRAERLAERDRRDNLDRQDLMLAAARAHAEAGDLERAITVYDRLIETDETDQLEVILKEELMNVRRCWSAIVRARELAGEGRHGEAQEVLEAELEHPEEQALPWKLETFPAGAMVYLPDGSVRITPFVYESRAGEKIEFVIDFEGHEQQTLRADQPENRFIWLARIPERRWQSGGRIDALPVAVQEDHIVCDRTGRIARLHAGGAPVWEKQIESLGGVARAPVFLPQKPGHLLLLTEDGEAWIINAKDGELEGPWTLKSAPVEGPAPTPDGVRARLKDGRMVTWTRRLRPEVSTSSNSSLDLRHGAAAGLEVLHRAEGARRSLESPWNDWRVEIEHEVFRVRQSSDLEGGFAVGRDGDWSFLAWEAPRAHLPQGRLWISDAAGLHAYTP